MNRVSGRRRFYPATDVRIHRTAAGLRLADVAREAGLTLSRASEIERHPHLARDGELSALRAAVDLLSKKPEPAVSATEPERR